MIVQIERIPWSGRRLPRRCSASACSNIAAWILTDRDAPSSPDETLAEEACCTEHISETYLRLRGAAVLARGSHAPTTFELRRTADRRQRETEWAPQLNADTAANSGT